MIKFLPFDFLSISRRVPWKNENAVHCLQISALVPEIFKFEKWVNYANEMTDDATHSTQYYIKHINGAILANLQCRTLKLGRLIVLQETHQWLEKIPFSWQLTHFQSPPTWFQFVSVFQLKNVKRGHKLELAYLYACWILRIRHHLQIWKRNAKGGQKCL